MKQRNPFAVFFIMLFTCGIYHVVWYVKTTHEMRTLGADIPTCWLLLIPIANIYWLVKWCQGVGKVTGGALSAVVAFVLLFFLGAIGAAIIQSKFNKVA